MLKNTRKFFPTIRIWTRKLSPLEKRAVERQHTDIKPGHKRGKVKGGEDLRNRILMPTARMLGDEQG